MPNVQSRREELITHRLLMLVEDDLDDVINDFLNNVKKTLKHDEDAVTNNRLFTKRCWGKNPIGRSAMKNLRRDHKLHYLKPTGIYIFRLYKWTAFVLCSNQGMTEEVAQLFEV